MIEFTKDGKTIITFADGSKMEFITPQVDSIGGMMKKLKAAGDRNREILAEQLAPQTN